MASTDERGPGSARDPAERTNDAALRYYPRLHAVSDHVRAHLKEPLTLADAAQVAGLERKYFSVYFKTKVGVCFTDWVRILRVRRAQELMGVEEYSITRVAFASGFRDVRTFERAFKLIAGVSPAAYRASHRPNHEE